MLAHERLSQKDREAMRSIMRSVAECHGLTDADLYVRDRRKHIVDARHEAWTKCREAGFTFQAIAGLAGWDHTSVLQGVCNFAKRG